MYLILTLFTAGCLSGLAFPPVSAWPILFIVYPCFLIILNKAASKKMAFALGWSFGFGQFLVGLYWISLAFMSPGINLEWALPFLMMGLPAGFAIYTGLTGLLFHAVKKKYICHAELVSASRSRNKFGMTTNYAHIILFTFLSLFFELIRGYAFTGFPWNLIGSAFSETPIIQIISIIGIYGLSGLVMWASVSLILIKTRPLLATSPIIILGFCWLWGAHRLDTHPTQFHDNIQLRLVQAHINQGVKWQKDLALSHIQKHMDLMTRPSKTKPTYIVWPETAVPFTLNQNPEICRLLAQHLDENQLLMVGATRYETEPIDRFGNSLYVINHAGDIIASYDKHHLIPFAEYVPFRELVPFNKLVFGPMDFAPGDALTTLQLPGVAPFSPLICYEVIFTGEVALTTPRPAWILNLTNDGWYGTSSGPYQHLSITRLRAIEEGLPLVRSTNTGISAIIDPLGRITASLGLSEQGVVDGPLPHALPPTIFVKGGKYTSFMFLLFLLLPLLLFWRKNRHIKIREKN